MAGISLFFSFLFFVLSIHWSQPTMMTASTSIHSSSSSRYPSANSSSSYYIHSPYVIIEDSSSANSSFSSAHSPYVIANSSSGSANSTYVIANSSSADFSSSSDNSPYVIANSSSSSSGGVPYVIPNNSSSSSSSVVPYVIPNNSSSSSSSVVPYVIPNNSSSSSSSVVPYVIPNNSSSSSSSVVPYVIPNNSSSSSSGGVPYVIANSSSSSMEGSIYYRNSSHRPSIWTNNNSLNMTLYGVDGWMRGILSRQETNGFAAGFYCFTLSCPFSVFSVVLVRFGNISAVVWTANRDHPVGENATLELINLDLVLKDSDGTQVWQTNSNISTSSSYVLGINMTNTGNLILFNEDGAVVWQSFHHPTDTLLLGQRLNENQTLVSISSPTNWSRGSYYVTLTATDGFAAFTNTSNGQSQMYYQLIPTDLDHPNQGSRTGSNYAELQLGNFLVKLGESLITSGHHGTPLGIDFVEYLKLGSDGHLEIYRQDTASELREVANIVAEDLGECQYPRICGEYGVCRQKQCDCPSIPGEVSYFTKRGQLPNQGCTRINPLSCQSSLNQHHLIPINNVTYFNVIDSHSAFPNVKDIDGCKQACQRNCSCVAAFFRSQLNVSDGYCYMTSEVLSMREDDILDRNFKLATFLKVQIPPKEEEALLPSQRNPRNLRAIIVASSASGFLLLWVVTATFLAMSRKNKKSVDTEEIGDYINQVPGMARRFSYEDLRVATGEFKDRLGSGGFGTVFKGVLEDGMLVAVKRLDKLGPGRREFLAEVESIGSIHHFNLVRLIGYCAEKSYRLLVYEFMQNGSLDKWIFNTDQNQYLNWKIRKNIILGIAKGLTYLHEECRQRIIHLDIKPQNILLDENFNAKVSDFGLSKLIDKDESEVLTTMKGTPGYIAPEWGQLRITVKVDTYSFGILLLEVVCCRKNLDSGQPESKVHLLRLLHEKGMEEKLLDVVQEMNQDMENHMEEVERMIKIAAWSLQDDHRRRPPMSTVVKALEGLVEIEPNISYSFTHALVSAVEPNGNVHVSTQPQPSVVSCPR